MMGYRRFVSSFDETATEFSMDFVVLTADMRHTYGGGRLTMPKPLPPQGIEQLLDNATQRIVERGNSALPRVRAQNPQRETTSSPIAEEWARQRNIVDWPELGRR